MAEQHFVAMAGLDPAIHRVNRNFEFLMDARGKPAHDALGPR